MRRVSLRAALCPGQRRRMTDRTGPSSSQIHRHGRRGEAIALCPRFAPPDMNIFFAEFEMAKCIIANEETKINSVITKK